MRSVFLIFDVQMRMRATNVVISGMAARIRRPYSQHRDWKTIFICSVRKDTLDWTAEIHPRPYQIYSISGRSIQFTKPLRNLSWSFILAFYIKGYCKSRAPGTSRDNTQDNGLSQRLARRFVLSGIRSICGNVLFIPLLNKDKSSDKRLVTYRCRPT